MSAMKISDIFFALLANIYPDNLILGFRLDIN